MCKRLHTKPALRAPAHRLNEYLLEFQGDSSSAVQTTMVHNGLAALGNDLQDTYSVASLFGRGF